MPKHFREFTSDVFSMLCGDPHFYCNLNYVHCRFPQSFKNKLSQRFIETPGDNHEFERVLLGSAIILHKKYRGSLADTSFPFMKWKKVLVLC